MAAANGTLLRVMPNGTAINCEVTSTFSSQFSTDKISCKDNPNGLLKPGPIEFNITGEALYVLDGGGQGFVTLAGLHINKTAFPCNYVQSESGGFTISAPETYLNNISVTGGTEESVTFSFGIEGSGDWTIA